MKLLLLLLTLTLPLKAIDDFSDTGEPLYIDMPFSEVDSLYFSLAGELSKNAPNQALVQSLLDSIKSGQTEGIKTAALALFAIHQTSPFLVTVDGELTALHFLGYDSSYLYNLRRKILGEGASAYFSVLKSAYHTQNHVIDLFRHFNPRLIISNYFDRVRDTLSAAALNAPTKEPKNCYNNDVITMLDYTVQLLAGFDLENPAQKSIASGIFLMVHQDLGNLKDAFLDNANLIEEFSQVVLAIESERSYMKSIGIRSDVIESILNAIPNERTQVLLEETAFIYEELISFLEEEGFTNPKAYLNYFGEKKQELVELAES